MIYEKIKQYPIIDTHVHRVHPEREPEFGKIAGGYIDGPKQDINSRNTILYEMIIEALRKQFDMPEASASEIESERQRRMKEDSGKYMKDLFSQENVKVNCFEIGSPLRGTEFTDEETIFFNNCITDSKIRSIVRIERSVDELIVLRERFADFKLELIKDIERRIVREDAVGLKSAVAYYGGLNYEFCSEEEAEKAYEKLISGKGTKADEKKLYSYTLMLGTEIADKYNLPLQIHTGAGGGSLDFKSFNPVGLIDYLRDSRVFNKVKIVLLHGGHPHEADTSFITAQFSNVYTDCSGTFYLTTVNAKQSLRALMERTPMNKLMYGSDGVMFPELAWFSHKYFKKILASVFEEYVNEGFISENRALEFIHMILFDNALECYSKLKGDVDNIV